MLMLAITTPRSLTQAMSTLGKVAQTTVTQAMSTPGKVTQTTVTQAMSTPMGVARAMVRAVRLSLSPER
jgi:hypothetical protein